MLQLKSVELDPLCVLLNNLTTYLHIILQKVLKYIYRKNTLHAHCTHHHG